METEIEPLSLSDFNEIDSVDLNTSTSSAENLNEIGLIVLEIWPSQKAGDRGMFIQAGTFIGRNTVIDHHSTLSITCLGDNVT